MTEPMPVDVTPQPLVVVDPAPDPSIAPGVDPDAPADDTPAADVAVRYVGADDLTVIGVGSWVAGDSRAVPAWLAGRLLQRSDFVEVAADEAPVDQPATDSGPSRAGRRKAASTDTTTEPAAEPATDSTP